MHKKKEQILEEGREAALEAMRRYEEREAEYARRKSIIHNCCENETRDIRGGCTNCGDPCL